MRLKMKSKGYHENFLNLTYTSVKSLAFYQALCNCDFNGQWAMVKSIGSDYWQDFCRSSRNTWYVSAFCNPPRAFPDISWNIFWRCISNQVTILLMHKIQYDYLSCSYFFHIKIFKLLLFQGSKSRRVHSRWILSRLTDSHPTIQPLVCSKML